MAHGIDLVIFDCDGVLVDSEALSAEILTGMLAEIGVDVDFDDFCANFLGRSFPTVAADIGTRFGRGLPPGFEAAYRTRLLATYSRDLAPTPGVAAMLASLTVPFCLATSSSPERCAHSLRVTGLDAAFGDRVFTASMVAHGKPAPDLFLHAAARMDAPPARCLVVEDSLPGIAAARAAGMPVLRYTGGSHLRDRRLKHDDDVRIFDSWTEFAQMSGLRGGAGPPGPDPEVPPR